MNTLIFGSGPAALFAAHAATESGEVVRIISEGGKSRLRGAQYMRQPIPGLTGNPFLLSYKLDGPWEGYETKVQGDTIDMSEALQTLEDEILAWDIRVAYDEAWRLYGPLVEQGSYEGVLSFYDHQWADTVIMAIPKFHVCDFPMHRFSYKSIFVTDFVKPVGVFSDKSVDDLVVCSGLDDDWWYRQSRIGGYECTEFPSVGPHPQNVQSVLVPTSTDCGCHKEFLYVGSRGKWQIGVFAESAYYETLEELRVKA